MPRKKIATAVTEDFTIEVEEVEGQTDEASQLNPLPTDPKWTEYVLSHLNADEKIDGNPTTDGLRRLVELFLGEIVESQVDAVHVEPRWSTIKHTVVIDVGGGLRRYSEIADVHGDNTDELFLRYASATASTRAEGRALRKALKLRRVLAAEEVLSGQPAGIAVSVAVPNDPNKMSPLQANMLNAMFDRLKINGWKYIQEILSYIAPEEKYTTLNEIPSEHVAVIVQHVQKYQQIDPKTGALHEVPEALRGYSSDFLSKWQGSL